MDHGHYGRPSGECKSMTVDGVRMASETTRFVTLELYKA
jgi:hypothetical protein